jgi:hypothetical protein
MGLRLTTMTTCRQTGDTCCLCCDNNDGRTNLVLCVMPPAAGVAIDDSGGGEHLLLVLRQRGREGEYCAVFDAFCCWGCGWRWRRRGEPAACVATTMTGGRILYCVRRLLLLGLRLTTMTTGDTCLWCDNDGGRTNLVLCATPAAAGVAADDGGGGGHLLLVVRQRWWEDESCAVCDACCCWGRG